MKSLLHDDSSINLKHIKWFRSLINSDILMKSKVYEIQKIDNKREFNIKNGLVIYNKSINIDALQLL